MSLNAATIEILLAKGLTGEDLLAVARAMEVRRDPTAAERMARHRSKEDATRNVTRNNDETLSPLAPPKVSPDPFKITPPIPPKPTNELRARRLPDDWKPLPLFGKALSMVERWQPGEIEREIAKFRNYWMGKAGKDACKTDWQRTFINWLISADERKPQNDRTQSPGIGRNEAAARATIDFFEQSGHH